MPTNLAIISTNRFQYSETFIHSHIQYLPAQITLYSEGYLPIEVSHDKGSSFLPIPKSKGLLFKKTSHESNLKASLKENNITAVLAEYGPSGVALFPICKALKIPLIVHFHGYDAYRDDVLQTYGQKYKELFALAQAFVCVSKNMEDQLLGLGCPREKLHLIHYGIDPLLFQPSAKIERRFGQFISCGRFVAKKSPFSTIRAFNLVQEKYPESRLTMIGGGELLDECKELCSKLGLIEKVEFAGILSQTEIIKHYQTAFAFLQHSIRTSNNDSEGAPLSIMEASAAGLPVVSTFHAGIPEIIADSVTGFLVNENDIEAMAQKMIRLLEDPKKARSIGKMGQDKIMKEFHRDGYICKLKDLIEKTIVQHGNF